MNSRPLIRRTRFLIKPAYQLKAALLLVVSFIIYSIILGFIVFYPLFQELQGAVNVDEQEKISEMVLYLHSSLWPAVITVALLIGIHVILASHRFFGPIYRFEQTLKGFLGADFSQRIRLRKHDKLKEMGELINNLAGYLEKTRSVDSEFHSSIKSRLAEVTQKLGSENKAHIMEARDIIQGLIAELDSSGDTFRIVPGPAPKTPFAA